VVFSLDFLRIKLSLPLESNFSSSDLQQICLARLHGIVLDLEMA
jgi:hypothetical protein